MNCKGKNCTNYVTERQAKLHDGMCPDCDDRLIPFNKL